VFDKFEMTVAEFGNLGRGETAFHHIAHRLVHAQETLQPRIAGDLDRGQHGFVAHDNLVASLWVRSAGHLVAQALAEKGQGKRASPLMQLGFARIRARGQRGSARDQRLRRTDT